MIAKAYGSAFSRHFYSTNTHNSSYHPRGDSNKWLFQKGFHSQGASTDFSWHNPLVYFQKSTARESQIPVTDFAFKEV